MTDNTRHEPTDGAEVIDLACVRLEDALVEGRLDERSLAHLETCPRCLSMKQEMDSVAALIAEATGPREIDASLPDIADFERTPAGRVRVRAGEGDA